MEYNLFTKKREADIGAVASLRKMAPLIQGERTVLMLAFVAIFFNSLFNLLGPLIIGHAVDTYLVNKDYHGIMTSSFELAGVYLVALVAGYLQTRLMGGVGQRTLFTLRNALFSKLQELPVAFFNANKAGDLISRLNNDTDKLNQFFSQSLMQFVGSIFIMIGAGIFLVFINPSLALAALAPALLLLVITRAISPWVKSRNATSLKSTGGMSAEIQESMDNFKVVIAFNRRDYFRARFKAANDANYAAAVGAGIANNIFTPIYGFCATVAQLLVLTYGVHLILAGSFTIGLLISFISYTTRFYDPLRQLASLWANFQTAMAGWDRVSDILSLSTTLLPTPHDDMVSSDNVLEFRGVHFHYSDGTEILHDVNLSLERGKTYALVGPTGGGKTTTASLMARLYDPTSGTVYLDGSDLRSYSDAERAKKIGFILQEPFLFSGTVKENIVYGNEKYQHLSNDDLQKVIEDAHLGALIARFDKGLETEVRSGGDSISLGQKQLIAFVRAALREPELLILDEATANIDTVTEQLLEDILKKLPATTTRVIIAHRLNTIESADEIFFVNQGEVTRAGSMDSALSMLLEGKRGS